MRSLTRYEDFDRDAEMTSEARVVNVSPHVARFEIASVPGSAPRRYKLRPGESVHLPVGYTREFTGAARQPVRATIESLTELHVWPSGPTLPQVVHEERAQEVAEQWRAMLAKGAEPPKAVEVMLPTANGGEPVKMMVQPAQTQPLAQAARAPITDDEDQSGPIDEPPPDHNEPLEPVVVPAAPAAATPTPSRGGRSR